ncbi:MAG: fibronectin type III domain-containing protein [Actinobacteria bacterium]|nr:fibronectin type III domain-containing protein [Actinomycetota bacterium]
MQILVVLVFALVVGCLGAAPASAYQSARTQAGNNTVPTDALERFIDIVPGTALQPGTSNPISGGLDLSFVIDLGRVPDSRTFLDAFRITNTDTVAHTIRVVPYGAGLGSIAQVAFTNDSNPGDGPQTETILPGTTELLQISTTTASAGLQTGYLRFTQLGDDRFFRRDLPITTRQAPGAPTGLTAVSTAGPSQVALSWSASGTGVGGYNVYRATAAGGPYTKINPSLIATTNYTDSTVAVGTRYWYRVRAVASGVTPELEGADSNTASGRVPPTPTSVSIPAGGSNPAGYINNATQSNVTVRVVLPAATEAGDTVHVSVSDGVGTVTGTLVTAVAGAQTVNISGINASALAQGSVALRAWLTKPGETGAQVSGTAIKDTIAAVSASRIAATASNPVNYINIATGNSPGTATGAIDLPASSMTTDTVSIRLTMGASTVTGTAAGLAGAGTRNITGLSTNGWAQGAVTVAARVQDAAGNDSGWIVGTPATRDTVAPNPPTAARIQATAVSPIDTINIATQAAAGVTVTTAAGVVSAETRLTVGATSVYGTLTGSGTLLIPVNATSLPDATAGNVQVAARNFDLAGNPSTWFIGNAARKDTVAPNAPNFSRITFTNRWGNRWDRVDGSNGALGSLDEVRIHDYSDGVDYPTGGYDASNNQGAFGRNNIDNGTIPRTLGYDVRDSAWNTIARICRYYTGNGSGSATTCP